MRFIVAVGIVCLAVARADAQNASSPGDSLLVSPAWLARHHADADLVVLHVSMDRADYDKGHVPGARWVNPNDFVVQTPPGYELPTAGRIDSLLEALGVTERSRIVFYGYTWMTPRVFLALDYVGLGDRSALLDGGLEAWRADGHPVSTEVPTWPRGHVAALAHPDIVVNAAWLRDHLDSSTLTLLDGRSPGEYAGSDHAEKLPRSGHIPGAVNLPWDETFTDGAAALKGTQSRLQPPEVLRKLFTDAGVKDGRDLITYCTVGIRASHLYLIARYLGWHPRIYDGSMSEWSRKPELPMVTGPSPR